MGAARAVLVVLAVAAVVPCASGGTTEAPDVSTVGMVVTEAPYSCGALSSFLFGTGQLITSCTNGFLAGSVCFVGCTPGFSGPGGAWVCREDQGWQNTRPATCTVNSCGEPFAVLNVVGAGQCGDYSEGGLCQVRCARGHSVINRPTTTTPAPGGSGGVVDERFFLQCRGGAWMSQTGERCIDTDGCENHPCIDEVSRCTDVAAPGDGYKCTCRDGFSAAPGLEGANGTGCGPTRVYVEDGDLVVQTGLGQDILFSAAKEASRTVDGFLARLDENDRIVEDQTRPGGKAYENEELAAGLDKPGGKVFETARLVQELQVEGELAQQQADLVAVQQTLADHLVPNGLVDREASRAMSAEAQNQLTIQQMSSQLVLLAASVAQLGDAHKLTRLEADILDTLLKTETSLARSNEKANADAITRLDQTVTLSDELLANLSCASESVVLSALAQIQAEIPLLVGSVLDPVLEAICEDSGFAYNNATKKCVIPPLGLHPKNPASSCRRILLESYGNVSGPYWLRFPDGLVGETYCDQQTDGGGWEILMKMGVGTTFAYTSPHWLNPTTVWTQRVNTNFDDAKFTSFNSGEYREFRASWLRRRDGGPDVTWDWTVDAGTPTTALQYFQTRRVLSTDATDTQEFKVSRGSFSFQLGHRLYGTNLCGNNGACVRWGFQWSDVGPSSNDAEGGIGTNYLNKRYSAGDIYRCCGVEGADQPFAAIIYGRVR